MHSRNAWSLQHRRSALWCPWHQLIAWPAPLIASCSIGCHIFCVASVPTAVWQCRCNWIGRRTCHCSKWWWVCEKIFVPAQADAFRRRNGQVSASRFFLWVCLADLVAVLWHAGQLVLSGEQAGGLRGCRWLCGPAGLGARNCTGECADGPAGGCLCGCIWLCCLGMPCHQELDQGMRRWASWWLALQQPAGGRSQMANGEGREGRWWPVGGLARTKPAALRATRLHPCVVTLGLASNTPRRRPLNSGVCQLCAAARSRRLLIKQAVLPPNPDQTTRARCCRLVLGAYLANFSGFFFALFFFFATTAPGYA